MRYVLEVNSKGQFNVCIQTASTFTITKVSQPIIKILPYGIRQVDPRWVISCLNAGANMEDPISEITQLQSANAELLEALKAAAINPNQQIVSETILKYTK